MKDMLEKMMMKSSSKAKDGQMTEQEKQAKMDVLKELLGIAHGEMGNRVKSGMDEMQKVTVAAPDKESLLKGLDKAKELTSSEKMAKMMDPTDEEAHESSKDEEQEEQEEKSQPDIENDSDSDPKGLIEDDNNHQLSDLMSNKAMDENFNSKKDAKPVADDMEESMFGTSLKKKSKDAKRKSYANMMSDEE